MARKAKTYSNISEIREIAVNYGVDKNPMFESTLRNYETVQKAIEIIHKTVEQEDLTITKEYVKGRENTYLHPAVKELPRQVDIANKTMDTMLKIISQFGVQKETDELLDFLESGRK